MDMGMMPPLQLQLGSTATSGATGSTGVGTGMGAMSQGNWIIQSGQGNTSNAASTPQPITSAGLGSIAKPAASSSTLLLAAGAGLLFFLMKKK